MSWCVTRWTENRWIEKAIALRYGAIPLGVALATLTIPTPAKAQFVDALSPSQTSQTVQEQPSTNVSPDKDSQPTEVPGIIQIPETEDARAIDEDARAIDIEYEQINAQFNPTPEPSPLPTPLPITTS